MTAPGGRDAGLRQDSAHRRADGFESGREQRISRSSIQSPRAPASPRGTCPLARSGRYAESPQPLSALRTPLTSWAISTFPAGSSNAGHAVAGWSPRTMFTPRTRSLIVTMPVPAQSPTHGSGVSMGVAVGVGVAGADAPNS